MIYLMYFLGLLFLYPLKADAFMVPLFTNSGLARLRQMLRERGRPIIAHITVYILALIQWNSKNLYRHLKRRGVAVIVWVLNDIDEFEEALTYGQEIDGVMTDSPTLLK